MTAAGPTSSRPSEHPAGGATTPGTTTPGTTTPGTTTVPSSAIERANRLSAANMVRSLLPLVVICLVLVGWNAWRTNPGDPVREVDPSSTVQLAATRASYPLLVPEGLPEGYRPTSARTDAGGAGEGDPVTLQVGYLTPSQEYAGFVVSDDVRSDAVASVLEGAQEEGTVDLGGETWTRATTQRGETALTREVDGVVVLVTGSAGEEELARVASAVEPYGG